MSNTSYTGLEIAIIGMSCKFPDAETLDEFWINLKSGKDSISFLDPEELKESGLSKDIINHKDYVNVKGGTISGKECFDANFFGYTPLEAELLDPQIRLLHEYIWSALEHSGYGNITKKNKTGLFIGASANLFWETLTNISEKVQQYGEFEASLLSNKDFIASRIAYALGLNGPAVNIDTACSTSLVAIHMACRSLLLAECNMAIAGGVSISNSEKGYIYQDGMISSKDGYCRAFDKDASGTIGGSGVGVIVLKRLKDAIAAKDHIYAIVKGSYVNNDGRRKVGYSAPSVEGQAEVVSSALSFSKVDSESITYVETHGTGTKLGDQIEIRALSKAYNTSKSGFCAIGSLKTNIGHLDAAAGVASIIKVALSLKNKQIPPSLHFTSPHPDLGLENTPFYVNTQLKKWTDKDYPLRAGVSSFGIGGTNAHAILESYPEQKKSVASRNYQHIMISAKSEMALNNMISNVCNHIQQNKETNLADLCFTLKVGRKSFNYRSYIISNNNDEVIRVLSNLDSRELFKNQIKPRQQRVVFAFSGIGKDWKDVGAQLYQTETEFKQRVDKCLAIISEHLKEDIKEKIYPSLFKEQLEKIEPSFEITQLFTFILEYSLADMLMYWGIKPYAMIGYSFGEYIAATIAGVFKLEDALSILIKRGQLISELKHGKMLSVPLARKELMNRIPKNISLAIDNGPSCIVAGKSEDIDAFEDSMKKQRYICYHMENQHALHSDLMKPIKQEFENELKEVKLNIPLIPYISNLTGDWITEEQATSSQYWSNHMTKTVEFSKGLEKLLIDDNLFIEIGANNNICSIIRNHKLYNQNTLINLLNNNDQVDECKYFAQKLGMIWLSGVSINWNKYYEHEERNRSPIPTYSFEHKNYWLDGDPIALKNKLLAGELSLGSTKKEPSYYYIPQWKKSYLAFNTQFQEMDSKKYIVFSNELDIEEQLYEKKDFLQENTIIVKCSEEFIRKSDYEFSLNPNQIDHYLQLLTILSEEGYHFDSIIDYWSVSTNFQDQLTETIIDKAQNIGLYAKLNLVKALGLSGITRDISLFIITNNIQEVVGDDLLCPEKSSVLGIINTIPQEYQNIYCISIDLDTKNVCNRIDKDSVRHIKNELNKEKSDNSFIAIRGNSRFSLCYENVDLQPNTSDLQIKEKGNYIIFGGTGGIGMVFTEFLIKEYKANVILVKQSPLPNRNEWDNIIKDSQNELSQLLGKLVELENYEGSYQIVIGKIEEQSKIVNSLQELQIDISEINGIIHSAGIVDSGLIQIRDRHSIETSLKAKVNGILTLDYLLEKCNLDFCVLFSSQSSIQGAMGQVGYCVANAFLDSYAKYKYGRGYNVQTINWDSWEVGMAARSNHEITEAIDSENNEDRLRVNEGVEIFKKTITTAIPQVVISKSDFHVDAQLGSNYKKKRDSILLKLYDNTSATIKHKRPQLATEYVPPVSKTERNIVEIIENYLGLDQVGINDNFFDLGLTSLSMIQVNSKLNTIFKEEIPITSMFTNSTVKLLADFINDTKQPTVDENKSISNQQVLLGSAMKNLNMN